MNIDTIESLRAERDAEREKRQNAQIMLEQERKDRRESGLCIDAALQGKKREAETYWDGRMEAVRKLASERDTLTEHVQNLLSAEGHIKSNAIKEALSRCKPGISSTMVRVDELNAIADEWRG